MRGFCVISGQASGAAALSSSSEFSPPPVEEHGIQTSMIKFLAALLIVLSVVKLVVLSIKPRAWVALAKVLYARPVLTSAVSYVLAGLVLAILLGAGLTIVQVLAVCLFVVLLLVAGLSPYACGALRWFEGQDLRQLLKDQWMYVLVWLILLVWGLYELLFA